MEPCSIPDRCCWFSPVHVLFQCCVLNFHRCFNFIFSCTHSQFSLCSRSMFSAHSTIPTHTHPLDFSSSSFSTTIHRCTHFFCHILLFRDFTTRYAYFVFLRWRLLFYSIPQGSYFNLTCFQVISQRYLAVRAGRME